MIDICLFIAGDLPECSFALFAQFDRSKRPCNDAKKMSEDFHGVLVQSALQAGFQLSSNKRSCSKLAFGNLFARDDDDASLEVAPMIQVAQKMTQ